MIKEANDLGEPQYKQDGTMTWDYFLATYGICLKYTIQQTQVGLEEQQAKRREAIKNNNEEQFQKLILETANWEKLTENLIQANLY